MRKSKTDLVSHMHTSCIYNEFYFFTHPYLVIIINYLLLFQLKIYPLRSHILICSIQSLNQLFSQTFVFNSLFLVLKSFSQTNKCMPTKSIRAALFTCSLPCRNSSDVNQGRVFIIFRQIVCFTQPTSLQAFWSALKGS